MQGWNFKEINTCISWLRSVNTDVMRVVQELEAELTGKALTELRLDFEILFWLTHDLS